MRSNSSSELKKKRLLPKIGFISLRISSLDKILLFLISMFLILNKLINIFLLDLGLYEEIKKKVKIIKKIKNFFLIY